MKNLTVEKMIREHYVLRHNDKVTVQFLSCIDGVEEYLVQDYQKHDGHTTIRETFIDISMRSRIILKD